MQSFPPTVILRHRRENLKKCSLRGLEQRSDFRFFTYPKDSLPCLSDYVLLTVDAAPLSSADAGLGLFILDGTWRYAETMYRWVAAKQPFVYRSIPPDWRTAYPRRQPDCPDPEKGLASIEAIFAAYHILGRSTEGLLDGYHWREQFLELNKVR